MLFPSGTEPDVSQALAQAVASVPGRHRNEEASPSIFVRLLPHSAEPLFVPLGLMALPQPGGSKDFLGFHFRIESPLIRQDYSRSRECIRNWVLVVPPENAQYPLNEARKSLKVPLDGFRGWRTFTAYDNLDQFSDWLRNETGESQSTALMILSHHDKNKLYFSDSQFVVSANAKKLFPVPSIVILNACGTVKPGVLEFIRQFNEHGVTAAIATSTG